jgi:PAS domain-containing protein
MLGYSEEELRKLTFLEITEEDYRDANWELISELLEGKRQQFQVEKQYRREDGTLRRFGNNVSLVPGIQSMCVVPLVLQVKCIGILSIVSLQRDRYSDEDAVCCRKWRTSQVF